MEVATSTEAPVRLSERAVQRLKQIYAADGRAGVFLRLSVEGGGCSGFRYRFDLDDRPREDDLFVERDGVRVAVDGMALLFLVGAELDFVEDLTGAYFRVHNPNATASCGCGHSFAV